MKVDIEDVRSVIYELFYKWTDKEVLLMSATEIADAVTHALMEMEFKKNENR